MAKGRSSSKQQLPSSDRQTRQSSRREKPTQATATPSKRPRSHTNGTSERPTKIQKNTSGHSSKPRPRPPPANILSGSEDDPEESSKEDASTVEDDNNSDLQGLDGKSLQRQLFSERVKIAKDIPRKPAPSSDSDDLHPRDKRLFLSDRSDGVIPRDMEKDLESNPESGENYTNPRKHIETARDKARRSEVPKFRHTPSAFRSHQHHKAADDSSEEEDEHDVNQDWHKEAHYQPFIYPARILGVKDQPTPLRVTIKAAIRRVIGDLVFESAFPNVDIDNFNNYHRHVLVECAQKLRYEHLAERFEQDDKLLRFTASVLAGRSSRIRTQCKDITDSKIEGFYISATSSSDATERVAFLINDMNYIYPLKEQSQVPDANRPYCHPAIISSIKQSFFVGDRGSVASKYADRFTGSDTVPGQELELPIAMVSLVATTIHASLVKWDVNDAQKSKGFRAEHYDDIYKGHEMFLKDLKAQRPKFFHKIMHELHTSVVTKKVTSAVLVSRNAMARLSIPNDEDL